MIHEQVDNPVGDGTARLMRQKVKRTFRKEEFEVVDHYYLSEQSGDVFRTVEMEELTINQVRNQYRDKYGLPFPDQIKGIRDKYKVSASRMSEILGLGANSYRSYESGEVPSVGIGRFIKSAEDPYHFLELLRMSQEIIGDEEFKKLTRRVESIIESESREAEKEIKNIEQDLFPVIVPDEFTGYCMANSKKIAQMILFFSKRMKTWKTKLNKLLFYSDFLCFKHTGFGMSGLKYEAWQMGPVPHKFDELFIYIGNYSEVVERRYFETFSGSGNYGTRFENIGDFDDSLFNEIELQVLEMVAGKFKHLKTGKVVQISHEESAWKDNRINNGTISYKTYGFYLEQL